MAHYFSQLWDNLKSLVSCSNKNLNSSESIFFDRLILDLENMLQNPGYIPLDFKKLTGSLIVMGHNQATILIL